MNTLPRFKADLITGLDQRRETAQAIVGRAPADLLVHEDSDWTAKDLITHLTAFEEDMVDAIQTFLDGEKYRLNLRGASSIDEFNALRKAERAHLIWDEALQQWQSARDQLRGVIIAFPTGQLDIQFSTPFLQKLTLIQAIKGCGIHEKQHIGEIKTALED